jgi:hypothetical protein
MKISLVLLHKAFYKRGWLRNGGDDSVRMLLTVHDEVVLEVRHDRVVEVVPVIVDYMESPWRMPTAPRWQVPLVVEPLIGFNWASGFDAVRVPDDYEPKDDEVVVNGFAYHLLRKPKTDKNGEIIEELDTNEVLDGKKFRVQDPPWLCGRQPGTKEGKTIKFRGLPSAKPAPDAATSEPEAKAAPDKKPEPEPTQPTQEVKASEPKPEPKLKAEDIPEPTAPSSMVTDGELRLRIERLNKQTAAQMVRFVLECGSASGPILHITDPYGTTLVSPERQLHVDQDALIDRLREYNLLCPE